MLYRRENPHGADIYGEGVALDFSANTNPLGTPPGVVAAAREAAARLDRYPDPYCRELTRAIAAFEDVPKDYVLCGNGASELIYAYCRAARPWRAVELAPTFLEYGIALAGSGSEVRRFALRREDDFAVTDAFLRFVEEARPEAVFLCNPNNPTGRVIEPELMEAIAEQCAAEEISLFVDECFLDLSERGQSAKGLLGRIPKLFVLKAFTKSYGLAGARLGYGLCADAALLAKMAALTPPWNVSGTAQAAGVAALKEGTFLKETREMVFAERKHLAKELGEMGFYVCPGEANFLLFAGKEGLCAALRKRGIALRDCANFHGLGPGWYRAAVKKPGENARLAQAIRQVLASGEI